MAHDQQHNIMVTPCACHLFAPNNRHWVMIDIAGTIL